MGGRAARVEEVIDSRDQHYMDDEIFIGQRRGLDIANGINRQDWQNQAIVVMPTRPKMVVSPKWATRATKVANTRACADQLESSDR